LKSVGIRDLRPDEIDRLRSEAKSALPRFWQQATIAAASFFALYASYLVHGDGPELTGLRLAIFLVLIFIGLLLLPAVLFLRILDYVKLSALRADLKEPRVECFSAEKSPIGQTKSPGSSKLDCPPAKILEVLPHSGLVFLIDGAQPPHRMNATVCETAAPPQDSPHYALPKELASGISDEARERAVFERRRLAPAEIDELRQHVRRLRRPSGGLILFGIWSAMGILTAIFSYVDGDFGSWQDNYFIGFLGVAAATAWQSATYVRTLLASQKIAQDAASGWVVVIEGKGDPRVRQEVLPISSAVWSAEGKPSAWRLVQSHRNRRRQKGLKFKKMKVPF
jgi:hypothetical protein